jgi:hypothetical protein
MMDNAMAKPIEQPHASWRPAPSLPKEPTEEPKITRTPSDNQKDIHNPNDLKLHISRGDPVLQTLQSMLPSLQYKKEVRNTMVNYNYKPPATTQPASNSPSLKRTKSSFGMIESRRTVRNDRMNS